MGDDLTGGSQVPGRWESRIRRHRVIPDFGRDLRHGARVIRRNPGYAIAAILCLSLGIGVNSTVFSLLDGM
jgi:hypothetical protein